MTGTPFSHSLVQLQRQSQFIGQWTDGLELRAASQSRALSNDELVQKFRRLIIRHSKAQRIGGEVALALPASDCETVLLDMNEADRTLYALHACADGIPKWADVHRETRCEMSDLGRGLRLRREACAHVYSIKAVSGDPNSDWVSLRSPTPGKKRASGCAALAPLVDKPEHRVGSATWAKQTKYAALLADCLALRAKEPEMAVVCFTHYVTVLERLAALLSAAPASAGTQPFQIFKVHAGIGPNQRHKLIKEFQAGPSKQKGPSIFLATYDICAVGVTLTAASRVYLLEPSLDPAQVVHSFVHVASPQSPLDWHTHDTL